MREGCTSNVGCTLLYCHSPATSLITVAKTSSSPIWTTISSGPICLPALARFVCGSVNSTIRPIRKIGEKASTSLSERVPASLRASTATSRQNGDRSAARAVHGAWATAGGPGWNRDGWVMTFLPR